MAFAAGTIYTITITSDIVCPWCYIGHTRLTKAISQHQKQYPTDKFNLVYRPFYLNPPPSTSQPAFPAASHPRQQYYASKFGAQRAQQIFQRLGQAAAEDGLDFKFGGVTGHPRNAHRLVYHAQKQSSSSPASFANLSSSEDISSQDKDQDQRQDPNSGEGKNNNSNNYDSPQNKVLKNLWHAYFEAETDITDLQVLTDIGVKAGLGNPESVRTYLISGQDTETVDSLAEKSRDDGITGVPYYEVSLGTGTGNGTSPNADKKNANTTTKKWIIEGAQSPDMFERVFLLAKGK